MFHFETCAKLAAYLLCIGIALELSHRAYWKLNSRVSTADIHTIPRSILSVMAACVPMSTAVAVTAAFLFLIDRKSIASLGLTYDGNSFSYVAYGAFVALGCVTLVFLLGLLMGYIEVRRSRLSEDCVACLPLFFGGLVDFLTAAVFEEIVFRGYVFYLLYAAWGPAAAVVVSSIIFASAHILKHPQTPVMFMVNALIFGLLVAVFRYQTGSLWLPIGLHFGWNVVSGPIFGLPYSGRSYERGVVVSDVSGPTWLTGGHYSLDAGVLGTFALVIAAVGLIATMPIN